MMIKKVLAVFALLLLAAWPAAAADELYDYNSPEFKENASQYMCMCGCGQDHYECNMDGCGLNEAFKTEILEMLNAGLSKREIRDYYTEMYGEVILTAPKKTGFSLTAWVTPFVALGVAGAGITLVIRRWVKKANTAYEEAPSDSADKADEVENEVLKSIIDEERKKYY
ncbi:cytochrome c-type biogenesis protein CcmH [Evansella caseinilytica]|uniref:Cytochrome c-type biogenesis protein n=1 Tax=Evansella caseinilytica TaxID=1503961 RepID=A0A1H3UZI2_9BACI|nr:cytochrome c-type biogenesis protein [Evansella caseinilytica]SDZ67175.1 cytochrome c-type biogenesis protein CcmH [Evansella caseinilytica]